MGEGLSFEPTRLSGMEYFRLYLQASVVMMPLEEAEIDLGVILNFPEGVRGILQLITNEGAGDLRRMALVSSNIGNYNCLSLDGRPMKRLSLDGRPDKNLSLDGRR
jgi:hypothetical protein